MPRAGELIVRLKHAKGVRGDEIFGFGKADLFANLSLGGEKRTSKVVIDGGSDSVWDEEFSFKIAAYVNLVLYESLRIFIYDQDYWGDSRRGTAKIDLRNLLVEHDDEVPDREYPVMFHGEQKGALVVGFTFKPANVLPVVQPELTTVTDKDDESTLDHLIHKIEQMTHYHRKPKKRLVPAEHTVVVGAEQQNPQLHAHQEQEKQKNAHKEKKHRGWSSESESNDSSSGEK